MYYSSKRGTMQGMDMDVRGRLPMRRIVNIFGAVGYTLLIFAYAITLGVIAMWLVQGGHMEFIGVTASEAQSVEVVEQNIVEPALVWRLLTYMFTAVTTLAVLFVLVTLPYWLGRSGSKLMKRSIRYCQRSVTLASLLGAKALACGVGAGIIVIGGVYMGITIEVSLVLLGVVGLALLVFLIQHYLAKTSEVVEPKDVW